MITRGFLIVAVAGLVAPVGFAQTTARVYYRDRSSKPEKNADFVGTVVEENINGIKLKPQVGPERSFSVGDIIDVSYDPPRANIIPFQPILSNESALRTAAADPKPRMLQLIKDYTAFLPNLKDDKAVALKRHIQFRIAFLKSSVADNAESRLDALRALEQFRKEHSSGWQTIPAIRQLVQLQVDSERLDEAAKVLEEAAKTPGLAKEVKQELELNVIDLMIRAGKAAQVESKLAEALAVLPPGDPLAAKLKVYQLGTQAAKGDIEKLAKDLKAIIEQTQDANLKALAYNTLGDCYQTKGLKKDAMWQYLWVEVVYNQDRSELAKAVDRLARVFKDLNDDSRAQKYQEKLKSLR